MTSAELPLIRIDPESWEAWLGSRPLLLTVSEMSVLELLAAREGRVVSWQAIGCHVYPEAPASSKVVSRWVVAIRAALGDTARPYRYVSTLRGVGYKLTRGMVARPAGSSGQPAVEEPAPAGVAELVTELRAALAEARDATSAARRIAALEAELEAERRRVAALENQISTRNEGALHV